MLECAGQSETVSESRDSVPKAYRPRHDVLSRKMTRAQRTRMKTGIHHKRPSSEGTYSGYQDYSGSSAIDHHRQVHFLIEKLELFGTRNFDQIPVHSLITNKYNTLCLNQDLILCGYNISTLMDNACSYKLATSEGHIESHFR